MNTASRLQALRQAMQSSGLTALIIPSQDPHQSEYVAPRWKAREWISGFTGSAGTVVVTMDHAGLWTDSRYFLQAAQELADSEFVLHKQVVPGAPEYIDWLKTTLLEGNEVGIDGALMSVEGNRSLTKAFEGSGIGLLTHLDPVGMAWINRPGLPTAPILEHDVAFAGRSRSQKLADIRSQMTQHEAVGHLLVTLDDIAWTFNLRGSDVDYNPVFYAYALIGLNAATLFVGKGKLSADLIATLAQDGIAVQDYAEIGEVLMQLEGRLLMDAGQVSLQLVEFLSSECKVVEGASPSTLLKACKNEVELAHTRAAMIKDGVALLRLVRWLEGELASGNSVTEYAVSERLAAFRAQQKFYFGESFPAIAGYAGNGAIVHYRPDANDSAQIKAKGVFLLDSGGQYQDGTTDITRTFAMGTVPDTAKQAYTMVLKGHIALARAVFPKGTGGYQLDPLARQFLWSLGLNYGHGTGHGVGFFLNVHEGPMGISPAANARSKQAILPGMIISNEPGYYEEGEWGIRIENLVACVEHSITSSGQFYAFETLSLFPIDDRLIVWENLNSFERAWLREYHQKVNEALSPALERDEQEWLRAKCAPYLG